MRRDFTVLQGIDESRRVRAARSLVLANSSTCTTMTTDYPERRRVVPGEGKTAARLYRCRRGLARWLTRQALDPARVRRFAFLTFTTAERDPEAAQGAIRHFWKNVERRWGPQRRFVWLELQKRGAVHYHCFWLNPPELRRGLNTDWLRRTWGLGHIKTRWQPGHVWRESGPAYVTAYAKKRGLKRYQQQYDDVPRSLRTFMTERLGLPGELLDQHRDRVAVVYVAAQTYRGQFQPAFLELLGVRRHVNRALKRIVTTAFTNLDREERRRLELLTAQPEHRWCDLRHLVAGPRRSCLSGGPGAGYKMTKRNAPVRLATARGVSRKDWSVYTTPAGHRTTDPAPVS